ncbi:hypothetical protein WMF40_01565 [Sorangium sp. So ce854]
MLLGGLLALHLTASLLANLLAALLLAALRALELVALLLAALRALELVALLLAALRALELVALLRALQLGRLRALQLGRLRALQLGRLRALQLGRLRALQLGRLRALLLGALLAGLLLLPLQQRAEDLLGLSQVLLDPRTYLDDLGALDVRLVEDLEGAAVQGYLGPHEPDVELRAFLLLERLSGLDRAVLELLALRAGLDAGPFAPRQPDPVLLSSSALVDHLLGVALYLRGLGPLHRDLRQLDLPLVEDREQRRDLLI